MENFGNSPGPNGNKWKLWNKVKRLPKKKPSYQTKPNPNERGKYQPKITLTTVIINVVSPNACTKALISKQFFIIINLSLR